MLRHRRFGHRVAGSFDGAGRAHRPASVFSFFAARNFIRLCCGGPLGRPRRIRSRAAGRKRSANFADVELRRDFHPAVFGLRSDEGARKSSGNAAASARHMAALYFAGNARARGHSDRDRRRGAGVDAAAKNAARIRTDCDRLQSAWPRATPASTSGGDWCWPHFLPADSEGSPEWWKCSDRSTG